MGIPSLIHVIGACARTSLRRLMILSPKVITPLVPREVSAGDVILLTV